MMFWGLKNIEKPRGGGRFKKVKIKCAFKILALLVVAGKTSALGPREGSCKPVGERQMAMENKKTHTHETRKGSITESARELEAGAALTEMENLGRQETGAGQAHGLLLRCLLGFQNSRGGTLLKGVRSINRVGSLVLSREPLPSARTAGAKSHSEGKQLGSLAKNLDRKSLC